MEYRCSIGIEAFVDDIWNVLVDIENWRHWNTTVDDVQGEIALNNRIDVYTELSPNRPFRVKVTELSQPHRMVWTAAMPLGLFKGVRTFTLSPGQGAFADFVMHEEFSGLLTPVFKKMMPDLQPSFDEFAICLKREAEN